LTFLLLAIAYLNASEEFVPDVTLIKAGGWCGLMVAFLGWYNAIAGLADSSNR